MAAEVLEIHTVEVVADVVGVVVGEDKDGPVADCRGTAADSGSFLYCVLPLELFLVNCWSTSNNVHSLTECKNRMKRQSKVIQAYQLFTDKNRSYLISRNALFPISLGRPLINTTTTHPFDYLFSIPFIS